MTGDHLLIFNLATAADDPILGFTTGWINRLAAHYTTVDVITMRAGRLAVADNVRVFSVGKERGFSEPRRVLEFYRVLAARLRERRYAACFAHMMPLFALLGWPLLTAARVPITLWYTHRQAGRVLRIVTPLVHRVVTAAPDSFPLPTPKLRPLGHGIDTDFFAPATLPAGASADTSTIVYVARIMPIKRQHALIGAAALLPGVRVELVGDTPAGVPAALAYRAELERLIAELGLTECVVFTGPLTADGVRDRLRGAAAAVNLSPVGLFDKAALEALACGVPTIVTNPAFDPVLGTDRERLQLADTVDPAALADRLCDLLALTPPERAALGDRLRHNVIAQHSFTALIPRLVRTLQTGEPV